MKRLIIASLILAAGSPVLAEEPNPFTEKVFIPPDKFASDPPVSGKMAGDNCSACHGTQGRVFNEGMPALAGIPKQTFIALMMDFKNEVRPTIIMNHVARAFTDAEIERMAEYYSNLPATPWLAPSNEGGSGHE